MKTSTDLETRKERFGDMFIIDLTSGREGTFWLRRDGATVHYSRQEEGGIGRKSVGTLQARNQLIRAIISQMLAVNPLHPEALSVPSPDRELEEMYTIIEALNTRIGELLPQSRPLCSPPSL